MADQMTGPIALCQWCSAGLPAPDLERCPSCGATLAGPTGPEAQLPGLTTLDPEAILRARSPSSRPRNRILSFLTGDVDVDTGLAASAGSLAPPPEDVRREMLRLQLEAEHADLVAETISLRADVLAARGMGAESATGAEPAIAPGEPGAVPGEPATPPEGAETPDAQAPDTPVDDASAPTGS